MGFWLLHEAEGTQQTDRTEIAGVHGGPQVAHSMDAVEVIDQPGGALGPVSMPPELRPQDPCNLGPSAVNGGLEPSDDPVLELFRTNREVEPLLIRRTRWRTGHELLNPDPECVQRGDGGTTDELSHFRMVQGCEETRGVTDVQWGQRQPPRLPCHG